MKYFLIFGKENHIENIIFEPIIVNMTQLYSALANVYHEMYQHIFDYDKEFQFYDELLKANNCNKTIYHFKH